MSAKLEINNLFKCYTPGKPALQLDYLSIEPGEIFFLLGPSGCGKSTLLRILAGLLTPDTGNIMVDGVDTTKLPPEQRQCPMVFQNYALWPHLTVAENVAFGLKVAKTAPDETARKVQEMLDLVQLSDFGARAIGSLSGGQQQRVALARALAVNPRILLLDEPLSNLDAKLRDSMRLEIRKLLKDHNLTAIYVTHDRHEALSVADRIAVLKDGKLIELGTPQELYRHPETKFGASFLGDANLLDGRIVEKETDLWVIQTALGEFLAADRQQKFAKGAPVTLLIRPENLELTNFETERENCFAITVAGNSFLGECTEYSLVAQGQNLTARLFGQLPNPGKNLKFASCPPEKVVILSK